MKDASQVSATLLMHGYVRRSELPELDLSQTLRNDVERRLAEVGLELVSSSFSPYFGVRLIGTKNPLAEDEAPSNLHNLNADHYAVLVILWAKFLSGERAGVKVMDQVHANTIVREFQPVIGSRARLDAVVGRLRNLEFVETEGDWIRPGPNLELAIDGNAMADFVRGRAALKVHADRARSMVDQEEVDPSQPVLEILKSSREPLSKSALLRLLGWDAKRELELRKHLKTLSRRNDMEMVGTRSKAKYQAVRKEA